MLKKTILGLIQEPEATMLWSDLALASEKSGGSDWLQLALQLRSLGLERRRLIMGLKRKPSATAIISLPVPRLPDPH